MTLIGCVIDGDTSGLIFTDIGNEYPTLIPSSAELYQNYPNPFNYTTVIPYEISSTSFISIKVLIYSVEK